MRAVALVLVRILHRDVMLCVSQAPLPVFCVCFVAGVLRRSTRKVSSLLQTILRSGAPGRTVGEVADLRKEACVQRAT